MSDPLELHSSPEDVGLRLDSDLAETPSPATDVSLHDNTIIEQARQGDLMALRQFFNAVLAGSGVEVTEAIARGSLLQMSLASEQVPVEQQVVPLIRASTEQLGSIPFETIELYGERYGSELPYWRAGFQVGEPEPLEEDVLDIEPLPSLPSPQTPSTAEGLSLETETAPSVNLELTPNPSTEGLSLETEPPTDLWDAALPAEPLPAAVDPELAEAVSPENLPSEERPISAERQQVAQAFLDRYLAGERDFAAIDLSETDLSGINLTLADLRQAQLIWTNLQEAALYHVNLSGAKLRHANLKNAKLRSANLKGADFLNANLSGADLSWSNLSGANLTGADLTDASLNNAIISCVVMPDGTLLD
ncbi:MAG: pentapeptide repeat-containing protein [Thermosynechococcaceae cyanobacterium]